MRYMKWRIPEMVKILYLAKIEAPNFSDALCTTEGQPCVITLTPTVSTDDLSQLHTCDYLREIQYFDHFGNPSLHISHGFTRTNQTVILYPITAHDKATVYPINCVFTFYIGQHVCFDRMILPSNSGTILLDNSVQWRTIVFRIAEGRAIFLVIG